MDAIDLWNLLGIVVFGLLSAWWIIIALIATLRILTIFVDKFRI